MCPPSSEAWVEFDGSPPKTALNGPVSPISGGVGPVQGIEFQGFVFAVDRVGDVTVLQLIEPGTVAHFETSIKRTRVFLKGSLALQMRAPCCMRCCWHEMCLSATVTHQREAQEFNLFVESKQKYMAFVFNICIPSKSVTEYDKLRFQIYTLPREKAGEQPPQSFLRLRPAVLVQPTAPWHH